MTSSLFFEFTDKTIYEWKQSNTDFYDYVNFDKEKIVEKNKGSWPEYILVEKENTEKIAMIIGFLRLKNPRNG